MRLYIAGPVTGLERDNRPAFEVAAGQLMLAGHKPVIPHDYVGPGVPWEDAMCACIPQLCWCAGVALLDGWEESHGAKLEAALALRLGKELRMLEGWLAGG